MSFIFCSKRLDLSVINYVPDSYSCVENLVVGWYVRKGGRGGDWVVVMGCGRRKEGDTQDTRGREFVFVSVGPPEGIVG